MAKKSSIIMMQDEYNEWHETHASLKQRIQDFCGFNKYNIELMESYEEHGITKSVLFTYNGFGWFILFEENLITRDESCDAKLVADITF